MDLPELRDLLSEHLPSSAIKHANRLVEEVQRPVPVQKRKLGTYQKMTNEWRAAVSKHIAEHGNTAAVYHFSKDCEKAMSKSTVCGLKAEKLAALQ